MLPPSAETQLLIKHLQRIGCEPIILWPILKELPKNIDTVITTVEPEYRLKMNLLLDSLNELSPPFIAIVEYEDPSTLQLILEMRTAAVIERPIKPFGLLTNLMIARESWQQRVNISVEREKLALKVEQTSRIGIAELLLMHNNKIDQNNARRLLQKMAMNSRRSLEQVAQKVLCNEAPEGLTDILNHMQNPTQHDKKQDE
ncbi:ANTAR domain-containing protein [Marinomonas sp. C1424]|uniref:ANTAR domain-containing protein n=2 Tax=Marinomonas transparens TaxID=2795388 RepID=A0A934N5A3_9GAMM|nr:ANTAR domain-containing protein [Marinomonas transparens]